MSNFSVAAGRSSVSVVVVVAVLDVVMWLASTVGDAAVA